MKRIGLFGGTFDPIHKGHINLAKKALETFDLDEIIFIPAGNPPHKTGDFADKVHRLNMVNLATFDNPCFKVSDFDLNRDTPNYSFVTISHFKEKYPDCEFLFIIGADSFCDLPKWKNYELLISLTAFIVVSRPGIKKDDYYKNYKGLKKPDALFLDNAHFDFSSTEIREKIKNSEPYGTLVPQKVKEYITENNLYL